MSNTRQMAHALLDALLDECEKAGEDFGDFDVKVEFMNGDEATDGYRIDTYRGEIVTYTDGAAHLEEASYRRHDYNSLGDLTLDERENIEIHL